VITVGQVERIERTADLAAAWRDVADACADLALLRLRIGPSWLRKRKHRPAVAAAEALVLLRREAALALKTRMEVVQ
jgi:hypothetical protein